MNYQEKQIYKRKTVIYSLLRSYLPETTIMLVAKQYVDVERRALHKSSTNNKGIAIEDITSYKGLTEWKGLAEQHEARRSKLRGDLIANFDAIGENTKNVIGRRDQDIYKLLWLFGEYELLAQDIWFHIRYLKERGIENAERLLTVDGRDIDEYTVDIRNTFERLRDPHKLAKFLPTTWTV